MSNNRINAALKVLDEASMALAEAKRLFMKADNKYAGDDERRIAALYAKDQAEDAYCAALHELSEAYKEDAAK